MFSLKVLSVDEELFSREGVFIDSEYYIEYFYDPHSSPKTYGITDSQLKGNLGNELEDDIRNIPHVKNVHIERTTTHKKNPTKSKRHGCELQLFPIIFAFYFC